MLQQNFSRPHITNVMENVADFLQFRLVVSAIGNEYLYRSIPPGQKFPASSKSVHRLGNRWVIKCQVGYKMSVCDDIHRFLYMYALIDRLKRKRETKLCCSSPLS